MDPAVLAVTPAGPHPPGVTPDLVNGANMGRHSFVVANVVTCLVLTTVVVALRMFARVVVIKTVDWSDCMPGQTPMMLEISELTDHLQTWPFLDM